MLPGKTCLCPSLCSAVLSPHTISTTTKKGILTFCPFATSLWLKAINFTAKSSFNSVYWTNLSLSWTWPLFPLNPLHCFGYGWNMASLSLREFCYATLKMEKKNLGLNFEMYIFSFIIQMCNDLLYFHWISNVRASLVPVLEFLAVTIVTCCASSGSFSVGIEEVKTETQLFCLSYSSLLINFLGL